MGSWICGDFFPSLYCYSCLRDTDCRCLSFKMTLLNSPARGCAKRGTNIMTNDKNASLCPSSADGREDGPGVLRGARPRPEMGQCQSSLVSQQLQKPHVIQTSPGAILIDSMELKATFSPCPVVFSIIIKFISPDLPL